MLADKSKLAALLAHLNINYDVIEHPALHSSLAADELMVERPGTRLKNLFLRDNEGKKHFLVITAHDKQLDLKSLAKYQGLSRLGFASDERLARFLKVAPGCVSMLALMNDKQNDVTLWLDQDIWFGDLFHCHPFENTQTWLLKKADLDAFFATTGHQPKVVFLPAR
ncbi:prolyl-tRNA synthetase associated domain-containing protein [Pseudoalteromonas sp. SR44-5]|jgi:Ala-tRNA(Pro) deacylase|uniref:Prolyl-tRNA synthetase associated domain-containing protein n=2 Tax=Pseudoalteromonas TaxID=53246 RepID=A0ABY3FD89_9GAMM|nr:MULTISPECIES: prolyl-tRNA synthetase associated domain-containing protein [Pseudoalteromonas]MBB1294914.1 prolyl-tRNA synthetase associated domain-containing protein [Pseudoalteromonas sp. SR41-4]MBB1302844.1 prolyl-tRNA synthetase associated domain-containing protein [Pseudoalteromonas sp. SR44-8]MBB1311024.1 prolyl-tRNA synthetase associated domain-containing protein [Pseudoalteromonas sp. SR41-8]MBB1335089.1 prolyl-tRNA synthetase associated domain-containing protein [Pseudoalteromonas sp|tara:strand:- start:1313 stop:1813 length:501 start_codon:yes stop_codon:yes gene_type:complete